jgi:LPXTG-motif cell wall-anchored protein
MTTAPELHEGPSYLIWGGVILLIVIVAFFLFRRSGD